MGVGACAACPRARADDAGLRAANARLRAVVEAKDGRSRR